MEWDVAQLACFRAVAEEENFTRAADELGISQPAVSKQVAELERGLSVKLFLRGSRRATLTEAGELLLTYARQIAAVTDEAESAMADLSAMRRGRLRVAATSTLGTYLLPRTLVYFRARFPGIEVSVDVAPASALSAKLDDGALDVLLTPRQSTGAANTQFMTDPLLLVCAKGHPFAGRRSVELAGIADHRFVLRDGQHRTAGFVERMLRGRQCLPTSVLRLPNTESVKQAVLAGVGVGFLPRVAVSDEIAAGRLVSVAVKGFILNRQYYWAVRDAGVPSRGVRAYACILKHAVRGSLPPVRA